MRQPVVRKVRSLGIRLLFVAATVVLLGAADYYKLPHIHRIDRDLYRSANVLIETHSCLHRAAGEGALLMYEGPGDYAIIWQDSSTCEVQRVAVLDETNARGTYRALALEAVRQNEDGPR
jgi:hypothetical protein